VQAASIQILMIRYTVRFLFIGILIGLLLF